MCIIILFKLLYFIKYFSAQNTSQNLSIWESEKYNTLQNKFYEIQPRNFKELRIIFIRRHFENTIFVLLFLAICYNRLQAITKQ